MLDYEKLGVFYLGKRVDDHSGKITDDVVLYDAKDLTTHAVIIGMTGSGKTGLGIGLLEEAAMDSIPVIAVDPKGDLGNIMLTFPGLSASEFRPWINPRQASDNGQSEDEFAAAQAALWKKGLADWGQDGARIARMRQNVDLAIYTPGSSAGTPISVLQSFTAPSQALLDDADLYADRIQAVASGVLTLLRIDADPVSSREHILLSRLLDHAWQQGSDLGIAELIAAIQNPPLKKIGVMDVDLFYPAKDRFGFAMKLNNLLAAPGFSAWTNGEPLSAARLLYTDAGKPRVSVLSIAHLDDTERMFFVAMLLNELVAWMRAQPGTSSLRAILYMDEIFGYMPPVENPPSKKPLLTLLKQARAYGLGLVLATQNPVDLDYRGLSNTGTWMIGRMQTERDKARVMEGLEGASQDGEFDRQKMEQTIAGLGKRRFLLHNVHEDEAIVFNTRWAMSYLAGPLTREQIRQLATSAEVAPTNGAEAAGTVRAAPTTAVTTAPVLPPGVDQYFVAGQGDGLIYYPRLFAITDIGFSSARYKVDERREISYGVEFDEGALAIDWDAAEQMPLTAAQLQESPIPAAQFTECPASALQSKNYGDWQRQLKSWLRKNESIVLYQHKQLRVTSLAAESEGEFRSRLQLLASEQRDAAVAKLRQRYASKATTLENRLLRAEHAIQREQQQASTQKMSTAISFGTAILGAVLGRKRLSSTTASKLGTAINKAGSARKQAGDVARARQTADKVRADLAELNAALEEEVAALGSRFNAQDEELVEIRVRPKSTDIQIRLLALVWLPYRGDHKGRFQPAWGIQ